MPLRLWVSSCNNKAVLRSPVSLLNVLLMICVIDKWLTGIPRRHFKYYLSVFRDVLSHLISRRPATSTEYEALEMQRSIQVSLEVMKKLYIVSLTSETV